MASLASSCADQSDTTDCLLRKLLELLDEANRKDDAETSWDPITFGFTVAIAIFAASLTTIGVVQGVLAAGPGRRKSNTQAIGRWSQRTEWHWSWRDLGFLHIARTPNLTVDNVANHLGQRSEGRLDQVSDGQQRSDKLNAHQHIRGASWLAFISKANLAHLPVEDDSVGVTIADYVPSDLIAVPAQMEIKLAVLLMALSGDDLYISQPESPYPVFIGPNYQLDIRQHSTLGTISSFSSFSTKPFNLAGISKENVITAERQAEGIVQVMDPTAQFGLPGLEIRTTMADWAGIGSWQKLHYHSCRKCARPVEVTPELSFSGALFAFLAAQMPRHAMAVFPWTAIPASASRMFTLLALCSGFFPAGMLEVSSELHLPKLMFGSGGCIRTRPSATDTTMFTRCQCPAIITACFRLLDGLESFGEWNASFPRSELSSLRQDTFIALSRLDRWLRKRQTDQQCQILSLFQDVSHLHQSLSASSDFVAYTKTGSCSYKDYRSLVVRRGGAYGSSRYLQRVINKLNSQQDPLSELSNTFVQTEDDCTDSSAIDPDIDLVKHVLVWRAILFAVLCGTAVDTAPLLSSGMWYHTIPMI